jgi:hypothetical protein
MHSKHVTLGKPMAIIIPSRLRVACLLILLAAAAHAQQVIRRS